MRIGRRRGGFRTSDRPARKGVERETGAYDPTVRVSASPPGPVEIRPFLLLDAEPGMRQRFEACCILRAELAEQAAKTWLKEFREPVEPTSWPAMLDGINCRGALQIAQERDQHLTQS